MESAEKWVLTMYFLDATGKKEVAERLSFSSRESAENAISDFTTDPDRKTGKVFTVRNEQGESIEFTGAQVRRRTIKRDESGIF
ncbi:MAG: hypothetical protein KGN02_01245 [bacterium]|nr:hypothetical protein [bacterium]